MSRHWPAFRDVKSRFLPQGRFPWTAIGVSALADPVFLLEVKATALPARVNSARGSRDKIDTSLKTRSPLRSTRHRMDKFPALSLCHAQYIRDRLLALYPECEITLRGITTQKDRIIDRVPRPRSAAKACSSPSSRTRWREERADFAVHSLKDMPWTCARLHHRGAAGARRPA